jgi:hypothetical protein
VRSGPALRESCLFGKSCVKIAPPEWPIVAPEMPRRALYLLHCNIISLGALHVAKIGEMDAI